MRTPSIRVLLVAAAVSASPWAGGCGPGAPLTTTGSSSGGNSGGGSSGAGGSSSSGGSGGSSGGGQGCAGTGARAQRQALAIYLMMDRSLSMEEQAGSSTKWQAVSSALASFVGQPMEGTSVGLQYFPKVDSGNRGPHCAVASYSAPEVEIGPLSQTGPQIRTSMSQQTLLSGTPTAPALRGAIDHATAWASEAANAGHAAVVVLATDGDPTTCDTDLAAIDAIAAAGLAASPSVRTFVIGVGDLRANLDGIARAGGTNAAYIVDTSASLGDQFLQALNAIRGNAVRCSYAIPAPPAGKLLDFGYVNVDYQPGGSGSRTAFSRVADAAACGTSVRAWHYDDPVAPKSITLCPSTCSTVEADAAAVVEIVLGCRTNGEW